MPPRPLELALCLVLATTLLAPAPAEAARTACSTADIIPFEANCPASSSAPCSISGDYDVAASNCIFDFGSRAVTQRSSSIIDVADRQGVRLQAGSWTMETLSQIRGSGFGGNERGASLTIVTTGNFTMLGVSKIDLSTSDLAGDLFVLVGGNATIEGRLLADGATENGIAGEIIVRAVGNVSTVRELSAINGNLSFSPGTVEVTAGGNVTIGGIINASGGDGGAIDVTGDGDVTINADLDADGNGDAGSGGSVDVLAGRKLVVNGRLLTRGNGGTGQSGGSGGSISAEAQYGDVDLNANLAAEGGVPDGDGDEIAIAARGSIRVATGISISARTDAGYGGGGSIALEADVDVVSDGTLDASGGLSGGDVAIDAGRDSTLLRPVLVQGRNAGSFGGSLFVDAGIRTAGTNLIDTTLDVSGGICSSLEGCGAGGLVSLTGCSIVFTNDASLLDRGADGGDIYLTARGPLILPAGAIINATTNIGITEGSDGSLTFEHAQAVAPNISPLANLVPAPLLAPLPLVPCPVCGNGTLEGNELCDDGNTAGCDGCSFACEIETCSDGNRCTSDTCAPLLGCRNDTVPAGTACCDGNKERTCDAASDACNTGVCNLATDSCEAAPRADGTACDDGNTCTTTDTCVDGICGLEAPTCVCACDGAVVCDAVGGLCRVELGGDLSSCGSLPTQKCCGNGTLEPGETCDDGNGNDGDSCPSTCGVASLPTATPSATPTPSSTPTVTPSPSATPTPSSTATPTPSPTPSTTPTATSSATATDTPTATATPLPPCFTPLPASACKQIPLAGASRLRAVDAPVRDASDRLDWSWKGGVGTTFAELGTPHTTTAYTFCVFDGDGANVFAAHLLPGSRWKASKTGFTYANRALSEAGIKRLSLRNKGAAAGQTTIKLAGSGKLRTLGNESASGNLPDLQLPLSPNLGPLRAQLSTSNGTCWEASYRNDIAANEAPAEGGRFQANNDPHP